MIKKILFKIIILGKCVCNTNFGGEDCSINKLKPPQIESISIGKSCDKQKSTCSSVLILVNGLQTEATTKVLYYHLGVIIVYIKNWII